MTGIVESEGPWEEDSVTHVVAAHRLRWASSSTEDATFGPVGAAQVAGWYERLCRSVLGSPVQRALFFAASASGLATLARLLRPEEAMPWIGAHPMDRGGDAHRSSTAPQFDGTAVRRHSQRGLRHHRSRQRGPACGRTRAMRDQWALILRSGRRDR